VYRLAADALAHQYNNRTLHIIVIRLYWRSFFNSIFHLSRFMSVSRNIGWVGVHSNMRPNALVQSGYLVLMTSYPIYITKQFTLSLGQFCMYRAKLTLRYGPLFNTFSKLSWGLSISNNNAVYLQSHSWNFTFFYITNDKDNYANYNYATLCTLCMTVNISKSWKSNLIGVFWHTQKQYNAFVSRFRASDCLFP